MKEMSFDDIVKTLLIRFNSIKCISGNSKSIESMLDSVEEIRNLSDDIPGYLQDLIEMYVETSSQRDSAIADLESMSIRLIKLESILAENDL